MAEWPKALAWKASMHESVSWVRIPLPPNLCKFTWDENPQGSKNTNSVLDNTDRCYPQGEDRYRRSESIPLPPF